MNTNKAKIVEVSFENLKKVAGGGKTKKPPIQMPPIVIVCDPNGGGCTSNLDK